MGSMGTIGEIWNYALAEFAAKYIAKFGKNAAIKNWARMLPQSKMDLLLKTFRTHISL